MFTTATPVPRESWDCGPAMSEKNKKIEVVLDQYPVWGVFGSLVVCC
jgi:hypothetical protein